MSETHGGAWCTGRRPGLRPLLRLLLTWCERRAFRRDLARMDAHLWDDLGLDADAARSEIAKPFWEP
ncbi:DUF1127 domain-containing protein [Azospirillum sp. ST 5-10]|uniref:DUF1127 domain-containing protein n=1 Tax=unclassified Azospirillum TaxID=2630922 RepID=UPI003F4A77B1